MSELDLLVSHIRSTLGNLTAVSDEENYSSLPFCVIDAVFSIGARYESTWRTVCDFRKWAKWEGPREYTVNDFLKLLQPYKGRWEALAREVFQNRQRTSTTSGILKAEAVYRFSEVLQTCGVNTLADIRAGGSNECLLTAIAAIPGQSSGISFKYFLMLAGYTGLVKPDRMVIRFVADALGIKSVQPEFAERLVQSASEVLRSQLPNMTASFLDYSIWTYQRTRGVDSAGVRAAAVRAKPAFQQSTTNRRTELEAALASAPVCWTYSSANPKFLYCSVDNKSTTKAAFRFPFAEFAGMLVAIKKTNGYIWWALVTDRPPWWHRFAWLSRVLGRA
jgi:hypothetical protein